jgi:taurine dioxygenase
MIVKTRSLNGSFAQEVLSIRLWEPQSDEIVMTLRDLWARHGVLVFRRQSLSEQEYADFCQWFGPLEPPTRSDWVSADHDKIVYISNLKDFEGNEIGGL